MVQKDEMDNVDFKWGIKRKRGGMKKDVQFYESFTYDGEEYFLYDSVYLFEDGASYPHIGKLIKIWELPNKLKKVKVLWFFRPSEISKYLGDLKALENELFLATGDGKGHANVNPLGAIAGKCNVICISRDERNRQPSLEELNMADHIFYRTFDVDKLTISDKLGEKIATVDVKFLLNKNEFQNPSLARIEPSCDGHREDFVASAEKGLVSQKKDTGTLKPSQGGGVCGEKVDGCKGDELEVVKNSSEENKRTIEDQGPGFGVNGFKRSLSPSTIADQKKTDFSKNSGGPCEAAEKVDIGPLDGRLSKKFKSGDGRSYSTLKLAVDADDTDLKEGFTPGAVSNKRKHEHYQDSNGPSKAMSPLKSADNSSAVADHTSKKLKSDEHVKISMQNCASAPAGGKIKAPLSPALAGESKLKSVSIHGSNTYLSKKLINGEIKKRLPDDKFHIPPAKQISKDTKVYGRVVEVTRRPDAENSKWFTGLPWEDKMKAAQEEGTLVLLQNLDPAYTSSEVEDIVWHGFHENCTAKVIQHTAVSSPYSGQAFVIFKTKQAAERIVRELKQGCLVLPNGRPLLAQVQLSHVEGKPPSFPGHLMIDRLKLQTQKDKREAVSTSHSSQPNTLEYDMAMEWRILQDRSDLMWRNLFKQQKEELMRLRRNLKRK